MKQTNRDLLTAIVSSDPYKAMAVSLFLVAQSVLVIYLGYKEQNCIIYFLVMQQTD